MPRNPDLTLNPEWMEDPCDVRTSAQSFSTIGTKWWKWKWRKCATSRDCRECDKAYGVTAIPDQDVFRKKVRTNFQLFITFGQQCTAVIEDEERRDVLVKGDLSSENMVVSLKSSLKSEPPMTILK